MAPSAEYFFGAADCTAPYILAPAKQLHSLPSLQISPFELQTSQVFSVTILNQPVPVYNIEVHGEHVYQVGELGLIVHNTYTEVSRWGRAGLNTEDWAMLGSANMRNYVLSGKWQPGFGNLFASYRSGATYVVDSSHLIWPSGLIGKLKGLLGQRIYIGAGI